VTSDPAASRSAGFVSRLLAVAVDSVLITAASVGVSATTELVATMFAKLDVSTPLGVIAASPTSMLATGAYFVLSWTLAGQTVGMRVLALRVIGPDERPPSARRALARLLSALIGALPLFAGYLLVLVDRRRLAFSRPRGGNEGRLHRLSAPIRTRRPGGPAVLR
jgi:uncharacterized RDD family membrane protein YckC